MTRIVQSIQHSSGVVLGGIGAGSVEVRPDGLFHEWQIFNTGRWSPFSKIQPGTEPSADDLIFILRVKRSGGYIQTRYLALRSELHDLYSFSWLRCVQGIEFDGAFPVARLKYLDDELPVCVTAEVFSPFIPHESRTSGTPGFYVCFRIENTSHEELEASILGCIRNFAGLGQADRSARNSLAMRDGLVTISLGADGLSEAHPTTGDMAFSARGGQVSYVTGAYNIERPGIVFYQGSRYGMKVYSYIRHFRDTGSLANLNTQTAPSLPEGFDAAKLSPVEIKQTLSEILTHPVFYDKYQCLLKAIPELETDMGAQADFLDDAVSALASLKERNAVWGDAALATSHSLQPGEAKESVFTVSWFFPNHFSPNGPRMGHQYENWFTDAVGVDKFLNTHYFDLRSKTFSFTGSLYDATLPGNIAEAAGAQLSTLYKCTWWTKAGHFGVWEGLGCCGFHTTDITYQGSFPIAALFPDLQKMQMVHGAKFQRDDGRVHHFFTPDFEAVDNGFDRVDMNQQFVMLVCRDWQWTGDRGYLETLWPHIMRAMANTQALDADGDGLPDQETKRNTYDVWDFEGCPSYIASLWLGALKAGSILAREMGETEFEKQWLDTYAKGLASFEEKLWNGEYYILWKDEAEGRSDECCMSDQISGDWFSAVSGWGNIVNPERIRKALVNILRYNFRPEMGLINASYPPGVPHKPATSGNLQQEATWTGIEYTVVSLLLEYGMIHEAIALNEDIHKRHYQAGRFWNHCECGDHYYRALSAWSVLISASGFRINVPAGELTLAPVFATDPWRCPFAGSTVWGVHSRIGRVNEVEIRGGEMVLKTLILPSLSGAVSLRVTVNGNPVDFRQEPGGKIIFCQPITVKAGDVIGAQ